MYDYEDFEDETLQGDLLRGVEGRRPGEEKTPQAYWASPDDILGNTKLHFDPEASGAQIFLGEIKDQLIGVADDRHIVTVAGSRAGKGVSALIPNLLTYRGSVLAIDPKGELACITSEQRRKGLGQTVKILDPFERLAEVPWAKDFRCSYNPLSILFPPANENTPNGLYSAEQVKLKKTAVEDAGLIADALVIPGEGDTHWDDSARNLLEGLILHVATCPAYAMYRDLVTVHRVLMSGATYEDEEEADPDKRLKEGMDGLKHQMEASARMLRGIDKNVSEAVAFSAADFFDKPERERDSVLSTARRHVRFIGFQSMQNVLCSHDLDLTELKTRPEGLTVYLCLPATRLATCSRWLRLFVNLCLDAMERVPQPEGAPPVLMALDEFAVMGRLKQLGEAAGQIAGFGVKLWPVLQDLTQLKALYAERWETFLGNAGILQFFGNSDITTLELIEKRLGQTTISVAHKSEVATQARLEGISGQSYNQQVQSLMTPQEIAQSFARDAENSRQLIIRASQEPPMILKRIRYYEHPAFKDKARDCPKDTTE